MAAWVENRYHGAKDGVLEFTGILARESGLKPLVTLLDDFEHALGPEEQFAGRLERMPEPPVPPRQPRPNPHPARGPVEAALEKARFEEAWAAYQRQNKEWMKVDRLWRDSEADFTRRVALHAAHQAWVEDREKIAAARAELERWKAILREAAGMPKEWQFFPPGLSLVWLVKAMLRDRYPKDRFDFKRLTILNSLRPIALYLSVFDQGEGYIAYVFPGGKVALENPRVNNALYFFHSDWVALSKLSKGELRWRMDTDDRIERFEHREGRDLVTWMREKLDR